MMWFFVNWFLFEELVNNNIVYLIVKFLNIFLNILYTKVMKYKGGFCIVFFCLMLNITLNVYYFYGYD